MTILNDRGLAIVSTKDDAHANIVAGKLHGRGIQCKIFETDRISIAARSHVHWPLSHSTFVTRASDGSDICVEELRTCWWRRISNHQERCDAQPKSPLAEISDAASRHLFIGGFLSSFGGTFLSSPQATAAAENKLVQITAAINAGLLTPKTIVSNDVKQIRRFGEIFEGVVIAKSLLPMNGKMVEAIKIHTSQLCTDEISMIPSIFQEYVSGTRHIRALIFGGDVTLIGFDSHALDWRKCVPTKMDVIENELRVKKQLVDLCRSLNLKMGIADLKINLSGEIYFLEINPQGQFLFVENYVNVGIADKFVDFMLDN